MDWIVPIVTLLLGFFLSTSKEWFLKRRAEKERIKSTKSLIGLEIKKNIKLLNNYWLSVSKTNDKWMFDDGFSYHQLAISIIKISLPNFSDVAWKSQLKEVTKVYNNDELEKIWHIYTNILYLQEIRNEIKLIDKQNKKKIRHKESQGDPFASLKYSSFAEKGSNLSKDFKQIVEDLIGTNSVQFSNSESNVAT